MRRIVVFDVDGVLGDGNVAPKCRHAPAASVLLEALHLLGYEIHAWSAGGADHARAVVEHGGYRKYITPDRCHDKLEYSPTTSRARLAQAEALLGGWAALQVDDDPSEAVGWPFLWADNWYGVPLLGGSS